MSVESTTGRNEKNFNGSLTSFDFDFPIIDTSDLLVIVCLIATGVETTLTENTDYEVSAALGDFSSGGTVSMIEYIDGVKTAKAWPATYKLILLRDVPATQGADFTENMATLYETFERGLDKLTMIAQQTNEKIDRQLIVPVSEPTTISRELPSAVARANKLLGFDADGEPVAVTEIEGVTVTTFGNALLTAADADEARTALEVYSEDETDAALDTVSGGLITNLKPVVNATGHKLDIFTKSGGAAPDVSNVIKVNVPDGNGYTKRSRAAAYLSGTSQIIMANAANYWSKGSLDGEIKTAWLYAIWDGTGIVWALAGYAGFTMVPTTTTETDDDFFLLEAGSTYTRSNSHYCVAVAKIRYQYDTADNPDHTIQATVENAPQVIWNAKSDYGKTVNLATTITSGSNIDQSVCSAVVKQSGRYLISGHVYAQCNSAAVLLGVYIKTGSATYGSAVQKGYTYNDSNYAPSNYFASAAIPGVIAWLNVGETIHLGATVTATSGNRNVYGDNSIVGATQLTIKRID